MRIAHANSDDGGWYADAWNSDLAVAVGYANAGVDEPPAHCRISGIFLAE